MPCIPKRRVASIFADFSRYTPSSPPHPTAKILNCSLNTPHPSVRTYYIRMYEAKFILGMIAGILAEDNRIGYIADYPIYGITASINAFALGAAMVNPHAKIYISWSKTISNANHTHLEDTGISYILDRDMLKGNDISPCRVGLYRNDHNKITNIALSLWNWGNLYEKIIRTYLNGWKKEASDTRAINYWWGMDADVIEMIYSRSLPSESVRLLNLLQNDIRSGNFHPFSAQIRTQEGTSLDYRHHPMTPNDIMTMNWLADNVIGSIPTFEELLPEAQALVRIQGLGAI
ncbi:MAG: BMP family ABC transporter substrate-binding protein [Clostridiales bacterium]|nr:BMP family ABC transporter substrate-binding protein [Clostridiales bacterium]